jgi:hypothetical protein
MLQLLRSAMLPNLQHAFLLVTGAVLPSAHLIFGCLLLLYLLGIPCMQLVSQ